MRVGLTGGLGSGKSTVGKALADRGAAVIDADQVARRVIEPGTDGERAVLDRFGPAVTGPDGHLDRQALASIVFSDAHELLALEAITHPLVHDEIARELSSLPGQVVVIELPLLTAGGRQKYDLDVVVLVDTPQELAVRRAVGRGMSEQDGGPDGGPTLGPGAESGIRLGRRQRRRPGPTRSRRRTAMGAPNRATSS